MSGAADKTAGAPAGPDARPDTGAVGGARFVDTYLLYLLARASSVASAEFHEEVRARGVPVTVWRILASLKGTRGLTVGDLARSCLANQPAISKMVDKLVVRGLLSRESDGDDRRRVWVRLTAAGEAEVDGLIAAAERHQARLLDAIGPAEAEVLKRALTLLIERAAPEA